MVISASILRIPHDMAIKSKKVSSIFQLEIFPSKGRFNRNEFTMENSTDLYQNTEFFQWTIYVSLRMLKRYLFQLFYLYLFLNLLGKFNFDDRNQCAAYLCGICLLRARNRHLQIFDDDLFYLWGCIWAVLHYCRAGIKKTNIAKWVSKFRAYSAGETPWECSQCLF